MQAATIVDGEIQVRQHPDPQPGRGQVLVRVRAAGLNRADLMQRDGHYPPPPGVPVDIPGMELAGEVAAVGADVRGFDVGARVMALTGGGAQAELAVVDEQLTIPVPEPLGWAAAAGVPEVFATAYDAIFTQGALKLGDRLLVHGAAGGVGIAAVQLGVAAGARVTASVRNPASRDAVAAFGATVIAPDEFTERGPFDVILELVGAPNLPGNLQALAVGGRICVIGIGAGAKAEVHLGLMLVKRARIYGSTLRARSLTERASVLRALERHVLPLLQSGQLEVPIAASYPLAQAANAYERFATGGKLGKIVLTTS
jgi:putative PIG3 family NAD(P)H quinone oxidoreductase